MLELSIVLPTCNRAALLEKCLASLTNVRCAHEIIVVDGASTDHTPDVLSDAARSLGERLVVVRERQREGFVRATNKGFRAARGRNMMWLNDDARLMPNAAENAIQTLDSMGDNVAFVALFHHWGTTKNVAYETEYRGHTYRLCHVRGTLYANFPLGRRATFERLGYFDERYYVCAADPDLSLKAWYSGLSVAPAWGSIVDHDETNDDRRAADTERGQQDNLKLFAKWDLPPKNPFRNDFDPANPCTLVRLRDTMRVAA